MNSYFRQSSVIKMKDYKGLRKDGFTLVEILIVIVVGLIIMGSVIGLFSAFLSHYELDTDLTAARQRGEMVFTILNGPVLAASLGIPNTSSDFGTVFNEIPTVDNIGSALRISSSDQVLDVVYSVPSGLAAVGELELRPNVKSTIDLTGDPGTLDIVDDDPPITTEAWVVFPAGATPCKVTDLGSSSIEIEPHERGTVQFFDEMHLVRAARARVNGSRFEMEDLTRGELLGSVEGIYSIHFDTSSPGVLTAYVLARGNQRSDDLVTPAQIDDWPEADLGALPEEARHYRLTVVRSSWRVRN